MSSALERPTAPDNPPVINLTNIRKDFGGTPVLSGVSISVTQGETVAIVGPSGSGKTTLLRCINLLEEPTAGTVEVCGISVDALAANKRSSHSRNEKVRKIRRRAGMIFQRYSLWPHMTLLENIIEGPIRTNKVSREAAIQRALELLDRVQLSGREHAYPATLSGGQQQRAAIVKAMAMDPAALLCDEVTSALDPELVGEVLDVLKTLSDDGMTMVVVTHEFGFARLVSDRVLIMDGGVIVEDGPPDAVFSDPQSERGRSFLASLSRYSM